VKLLLDSQALLWWLEDNPRLGAEARRPIADRGNAVHYSAATVWELSVKEAKGKLRLGPDFDTRLVRESIIPLDITHRHARTAAALPMIHRDPFDRLLVAQCLVEGMTLVTSDSVLGGYGIEWIAA